MMESPQILFLLENISCWLSFLSVLILNDKIKNGLYRSKMQRINYSTTYQGFSLGVAASIAVQKIVNNNQFLKKIFEKGMYMRNILNDELGKLETFKNTRGRGLRFSLEHNFKENNISAQRLSNIMLNKHKIIINSKWHRTCFTPAFIISYKQIDFVLDKFIKEFKKIS